MTLSDTQLDNLRKKIKNANNSFKLIFNSGIYNFNEFYRNLFNDTKNAAQAIAYVSGLSDKKPDNTKILNDIDLISYPIQVKYDSNGILITDPTAYTRKGVVQSNKPQTYVDPSTIPFTMQWYATRQQPEINTEATNKSVAAEQQTGSQNSKTNTKQATSDNKAFNQAFAAARKAGKGTFEFNGTTFTTQLGTEIPEQYQAWLASQNKSSNTTTNQAELEAQKKVAEEAARRRAAEEAAAAQRKAAEDANREQFRMQLAQQMQANPWYRPTDETLAYTGWDVTKFQEYLASPEAEQRRIMQHKVNMQNSRYRTKENNQAYRQAKRNLRNMKVK